MTASLVCQDMDIGRPEIVVVMGVAMMSMAVAMVMSMVRPEQPRACQIYKQPQDRDPNRFIIGDRYRRAQSCR